MQKKMARNRPSGRVNGLLYDWADAAGKPALRNRSDGTRRWASDLCGSLALAELTPENRRRGRGDSGGFSGSEMGGSSMVRCMIRIGVGIVVLAQTAVAPARTPDE